MVDRWEDRKADRWVDRMEGHLEDLMVDLTVVSRLPWVEWMVGMMLVVPRVLLALPTPASTA